MRERSRISPPLAGVQPGPGRCDVLSASRVYNGAAMEEAPLVQFATADGFSVAYWAIGNGPPIVQLPALPYSHISAEWEQSQLRRTYELLAARLKLVRYDGRGMGLSQREVTSFSHLGSSLLGEISTTSDMQMILL